jgi:hypothetical protein
MARKWAKRMSLFGHMGLLALMLLPLTGCADMFGGNELDEPVTLTATITLVNGTGSPVHLWTSGESINAGNKVSPGSSRQTSWTQLYEVDDDPAGIDIYAGVNGQTIGSEDLSYVYGDFPAAIRAVWTGGGFTVTVTKR